MVKKQKMKKQNKSKIASYKANGTLIIIGGHEDKEKEKSILRECARRIGRGKLVVATVASRTKSEELWIDYQRIFQELGVKEIEHLSVVKREQSLSSEHLQLIHGAKGFFFTGGDQLRITSEIGGTSLAKKMFEIYHQGGLIAGTSAGASVMGETMLVSGPAGTSRADQIELGAGLGFMRDIIVDQHFAERGRIGRLLAAVAQNPKLLGIGIDEDTAIIVEKEESFSVIGSGAVYVLDGHEITDTNISESHVRGVLSLSDMRLHILSKGDEFDFATRRPKLSNS